MGRRPEKLPRGITIYRGRYRVQTTWQGKTITIGTFDTKTLAVHAQEKMKAEKRLGTFVPPAELRRQARERKALEEAQALEEARRAVSVETYAPHWLQQLANAGRAESTIMAYRSTLKVHILPKIGGKRVSEVTKDDTDAVLASCKSDQVRNSVTICLRSMMNSAREDGLTEAVFKFRGTKPKSRAETHPDQIASGEQLRALADAMPPRYRLTVLLAGICALRIGEVLGLQRGDFTGLEDGDPVLHVRRQWLGKGQGGAHYAPPKADSTGDIRIPHGLTPAILDHLATYVRPEPDAPLFTPERDQSRPLSQSSFREYYWSKARAQVPGMEALHFHDLRHTGLTEYARTGATQAEIMARGRHKSVEIAARYQHATKARDRLNADAMGQAFGI